MPNSFLLWIGRWFRREPLERRGVPRVLGRAIDQYGKEHTPVRGWIKHDSLSEDQLRRVARLREVLREAYPMTMEGWIDGFLRDANPEQEIQILEACAWAYQHLSSGLRLAADEPQKLYSVLCALSAGTAESHLEDGLAVGRGVPNVQTINGVLREAWSERRRP